MGRAKRARNGHGGVRAGAGRPKERPGPSGVAWTVVRQYARLGADRDLIVQAMGIEPDVMRQPEVIARFAEELARGEALHQIDLLNDVKRLREGGDGSVNAVLASLKQKLGWNKPDSGKGTDAAKPDNQSAVAEIQRMLKRFRGAAG